jgi:tyrosinase
VSTEHHKHHEHEAERPSAATEVLPMTTREGHEAFTRADVVFADVDHSGCSYEVRLFLNNPRATAESPRDEPSGYAGRFHVFGHGGCFGDVGHCDVPPRPTDPTDLRPPHQLTPMTTYVTVTTALRRLLASGSSLETLTLVPISLPPRRDRARPAPELFVHGRVDLRTYLTPLDQPPP